MAATAVRAPFSYPLLKPLLESSAMAAASTCHGGESGTQCGLKWTQGNFDGWTGVGEQMSALEVFQSNLITEAPGPVTEVSGGTSQGDPSGGTTSSVGPADLHKDPMTTADKAGAAILTVLVTFLVVGSAWWMVV